MYHALVDVDPRTLGISFLLRLLIAGASGLARGVSDGQLAVEDEMRCLRSVRVGRVVGVSGLGQCWRSTSQGNKSEGKKQSRLVEARTYGGSAHVNTVSKPHDRTSSSALEGIGLFAAGGQCLIRTWRIGAFDVGDGGGGL